MNKKEIIKNLYELKENMPDLIIRKIKSGFSSYVYIITFQTVSSDNKVNDFILKYFSNKSISGNFKNLKKEINNYIPSINLKEIHNSDEIFSILFNGFTVVLYKNEAVALETKALLDRAISEPSSEPTVKGPKDSFNENINTNMGLIRKRLKNKNLYLKELNIGTQSNTKVNVIYMNNIAEKELVEEIIKKLKQIKIDGILDSYYIKELIKKENHTLFPTIKNTEKPDEVCKNLLDGKIIILVENSPNALIVPTLFIDIFHNAEDYYQKPFFVAFTRIIRVLAFFVSVFLPAFYLAVITYDQQILPTSLLLNFAAQRENVPFPAIIEAIVLIITFEILYEGDARTPSSRGTSLSILGALVLGDAAVSAGLVSPIMVIVVAFTAISSLLFIYLDLQGAVRFWRYFLMIIVSFFGIIGLCVGGCLMLINLVGIKSFGKPYLLPFAPLNKSINDDAILRKRFSKLFFRKDYLANKNLRRQKKT